MSSTNERTRTRDVFFRAWRHHREGKPLEGVERVLVAVALRHPEYQPLLDNPDQHAERDYSAGHGESNPFLHMGLHVAIEEQLTLNEPRGIREIYRALLDRNPDDHQIQHNIMECLGEWLWRAQQQGATLDPAPYLECLSRLANPRR